MYIFFILNSYQNRQAIGSKARQFGGKLRQISTMALRTVHAQQPNFPEAIPSDKNDSVYCPNASACFRPGESVVLQPSITGTGETFSALATILDVRQKPEAGEVKEVLLSLYLPRHPDMRLRLDRPGDRTYIVQANTLFGQNTKFGARQICEGGLFDLSM
jgi:hypothetical protein